MASRIGLRGLPSQIYIIFLLRLLFFFGNNLAFPYLAIYMTGAVAEGGLGIDPSLVGFMVMIGGFASLFTLFGSGWLSDIVGRKKVLLFYATLQAIATAGFAFSTSFVQYLLLYIIMEITVALRDPSLNAMIADIIRPDRREEIYGLNYMLSNVGFALAPPMGALIAIASGYSALFLYTAIFMIAAPIIIFTSMKESYVGKKRNTVDFGQFQRVFKDKSFIFFCFLGALTNFIEFQIFASGLFAVYTQYIGLSAYLFGIFVSVNGAMVVVAQIPIRKATIRVGNVKAFAVAQLLFATGFIFLVVCREFYQFLVAIIILTLGEITFSPTRLGFIANLSPADTVGRYMALANLFSMIGGSLGAMVGFGLYTIMPAKELTWAFLGMIGFATFPGYLYLLRSHGKGQYRTERCRVL